MLLPGRSAVRLDRDRNDFSTEAHEGFGVAELLASAGKADAVVHSGRCLANAALLVDD